jgi:hypothetical protein
MPRYNIHDINIGDKVDYHDDYLSKKHSIWTVVAKLDESMLVIEINKDDKNERRIVEISDIKEIIPPKSI